MSDVSVDPQRSSLAAHLQGIGRWRDTILVLSSLDYVLGYLVWSRLNWVRDGAPTPVLDVQYFVAGLVPFAALFMLVIFGSAFVRRVVHDLPTSIATLPVAKQIRLYFTLSLLSYALLGTAFWLLSHWRTSALSVVAGGVCALLGVAFISSQNLPSRVAPDNDDPTAPFAQSRLGILTSFIFSPSVRGLMLSINGVIIVVLVVTYFATRIYPFIPADFGGAQPRCAQLDLSAQDLSPETKLLLQTTRVGGDTVTLRTGAFRIEGGSGGSLHIFLPQVGPRSERVIEVPRSMVKSISWCARA